MFIVCLSTCNIHKRYGRSFMPGLICRYSVVPAPQESRKYDIFQKFHFKFETSRCPPKWKHAKYLLIWRHRLINMHELHRWKHFKEILMWRHRLINKHTSYMHQNALITILGIRNNLISSADYSSIHHCDYLYL